MTRCPRCLQIKATQHDWDTVPEGAGGDLCWGEAECPGEIGPTRLELAEAIRAVPVKHGRYLSMPGMEYGGLPWLDTIAALQERLR